MIDVHDDPRWRRIRDFPLDAPDARLTFTQRLARENGWPLAFARRVVDEYKRFCYLALAAGHHVTPSDEVDQAWHLHLTYTRSYWDDFCHDVLGVPLHHGPTRGGAAEDAKYRDWYATTLASYQRIFSAPPPPDIWPEPAARFCDADAFRRVNTAAHWVVPKPAMARVLRWTLPTAAAATGLAACADIADVSSADWPVLLGAAVVALVVFGRVINKPTRKRQGRKGGSSGCGDAGSGCGGGRKRGDPDEDADSTDSGCSSGCGGCGD